MMSQNPNRSRLNIRFPVGLLGSGMIMLCSVLPKINPRSFSQACDRDCGLVDDFFGFPFFT